MPEKKQEKRFQGKSSMTSTAKERFDKFGGENEPDPIEQLRFFCSLAMDGRDFIDLEQFIGNIHSHIGMVRIQEREACARLCEIEADRCFSENKHMSAELSAGRCAASIRERSKSPNKWRAVG